MTAVDAPGTSDFAAATRLVADGPGRWRADIHDGWDVAGVPNGGYLLAIVGGALVDDAQRPDPVSVTAHYVAPAVPGEATVTTEVLRRGRRLVTMRAEVAQQGRPLAHVLATMGDLTDGADSPSLPFRPPALPPPEQCLGAGEVPEATFTPAVFTKTEMRIHPAHGGFAVGRPHGTAELAGWVRFPDGHPLDSRAMLFVADAFPPPIFNAAFPVSWVPTIALTVHLHKRPKAGWIGARFHSEHVAGGYLEEDGVMWDGDGDLVAVSRQLALLPRGA